MIPAPRNITCNGELPDSNKPLTVLSNGLTVTRREPLVHTPPAQPVKKPISPLPNSRISTPKPMNGQTPLRDSWDRSVKKILYEQYSSDDERRNQATEYSSDDLSTKKVSPDLSHYDMRRPVETPFHYYITRRQFPQPHYFFDGSSPRTDLWIRNLFLIFSFWKCLRYMCGCLSAVIWFLPNSNFLLQLKIRPFFVLMNKNSHLINLWWFIFLLLKVGQSIIKSMLKPPDLSNNTWLKQQFNLIFLLPLKQTTRTTRLCLGITDMIKVTRLRNWKGV